MEKETKKPSRGGSRYGAGRHTKGSTKRVSVTINLDRELLTKLDYNCTEIACTRSDIINHMIKNYF